MDARIQHVIDEIESAKLKYPELSAELDSILANLTEIDKVQNEAEAIGIELRGAIGKLDFG